ncbi:hypothetical protein KSP39_PZI017607 [Platanthera zijinensis]|uniref:Uncharacterized protein n=1 Tax=Platanthera zijinensis TaxID=2320716 RepID=A0AAP0B519_9ASPA
MASARRCVEHASGQGRADARALASCRRCRQDKHSCVLRRRTTKTCGSEVATSSRTGEAVARKIERTERRCEHGGRVIIAGNSEEDPPRVPTKILNEQQIGPINNCTPSQTRTLRLKVK